MVDIGGQKAYVMHNLIGNVMALYSTDGSNTLLAEYDYSPYGEVIKMTGELAQKNPLRYSSRYHDDVLNLHYYGHRHYAPRLMRWLNKDPIGEYYGLNLYQFVLNNLSRDWDILGLTSIAYDPSAMGRVPNPASTFDKFRFFLDCKSIEFSVGTYLTGMADRAWNHYIGGSGTAIVLSSAEVIGLLEESSILGEDNFMDENAKCMGVSMEYTTSYSNDYQSGEIWHNAIGRFTGRHNVHCENCQLKPVSDEVHDLYDFANSLRGDITPATIAGFYIDIWESSGVCGWRQFYHTGIYLYE